MSLLKPATNSTAYMKVGTYGFQGSGKTHTSCELAIGISKLTGKKKVAFFDTEKGSDFHIERFKKEGLALDVIKSRSFKDLIAVVKEAESKGYGALIIDSVTHVWRELTESYLKAKAARISRMRNDGKKVVANLNMKDWNWLKGEWAQFTELFVNSNLHIFVCGRAGFEYDISEDDEGKQEIAKSGTKMKAEGEFGYESDTLIEMQRVPISQLPGERKNKKAKGFVNRATILKDRWDIMNAISIDSPKFKDFMPIVKKLNLGGAHVGVDTSRTSEEIFDNADFSFKERERRKEIALEKLDEALVLAELDGRAAQVIKKRAETLIKVFGTSAKTAIESLGYQEIELKVMELRKLLKLDQEENPALNLDESEEIPY